MVGTVKEAKTLNRLWMNSCSYYGKNIAFARHEHDLDAEDEREEEVLFYKEFTYEAIEKCIVDVGAALAYIGLREFDKVAILAENSTRMIIADFAVLGNRACNIPIATHVTDDELRNLLEALQVRIVVVDHEKRLEQFHNVIDSIDSVHAIVVLSREYCSPPTEEEKIVFAFDHLLQLGEESKLLHIFQGRRDSTEADDLATIMYTSGTTGKMKGVPLTHGNIMSNVTTVSSLVSIEQDDRFISILPSWHTFERTLEYIVLHCGASIWYTDKKHFRHDLLDIKPTYMASVPRIWISLYNSIKESLRKTGRDRLFNRLFAHSQRVIRDKRLKEGRYIKRDGVISKRKKARLYDRLCHMLADILFYAPIRMKIGGHFKAGISGGGHLPDYIDDFFEVLNVPLLEGYGLTEAAPVISVRTFDHNIPHTAGEPIPGTKILFLDKAGVETPPFIGGVIHVRGPQVVEGYFDGALLDKGRFYTDDLGRKWLNTGDEGYLADSGDLIVMGRQRELIHLSRGKVIAPESVEAALMRTSLIDQIAIFKAKNDDRLFALIVPNESTLKSKCRRRLIPYSKSNDGNNRVRRLYEKRIEALLHVAHLHSVEIADFRFTESFTEKDYTMTHTFKFRRSVIAERDKELLECMNR